MTEERSLAISQSQTDSRSTETCLKEVRAELYSHGAFSVNDDDVHLLEQSR